MTDDEVRAIGKKDFEQYWLVVKLTFKDKLPDEVKGLFEVFYKAGYLEGFRSSEEKLKCCGNCQHQYEGTYHNGFKCKDHAKEEVCTEWELELCKS